MFVVRKDQLEVFRAPLRQKKREELLLKLQGIEGNKVFQEKDKIVVQDKKGRKSILHYSDKNLLSAITKPSGLQVNFDYDNDDRLSKVEFPGNESLQLAYANDVPTNISLNGATIELKYDSKSSLIFDVLHLLSII
jgi:YD repeat-containing protein